MFIFKKRKKVETKKEHREYAYQKTLLYIYPYLGKIARATERSADVKAALSYREADTEKAAERILEEIATSRFLDGLKREMSEILKEFTEEEAWIMEYKFFRRKKKLEEFPAELFHSLSERTVYRRQGELLKKFAAKLLGRGLDEAWFRENLLELDWAEEIYDVVKGGRDVRVRGKHKRRPFLRRKIQEGSSFVKPNSSAGEESGCVSFGRSR